MLNVIAIVAGMAVPGAVAQAPLLPPATLVEARVSPSDRVWQALDLQMIMPILRDEAVAEAADMEADGLIAGAGKPWAEAVADVHDVARLEGLFREGIAAALSAADPSAIDRGLAFQESGLGRRLLDLELAARRAMLDDEVEAQARDGFARALARGDLRAQQVLRLIDEADLVAPNVTGALNASLAFSRGFEEAGGFDMPLSEEQLLAETLAQRGQIEVETAEWLRSYLLLSYSSLSDAEMETFIRYASSREGRAVAQVLFGAFDRVLQRTSFELGLAAALRLQGREL
ncbi:hypothetical protein [Paracoccus beibuensis]|uniref:hypothetical protein n=1 Tax=Paracoccus beibuensis TaxID=547602 RepID=UPI00223FE3D3|nr:hypothetical protein [Paracoccus beibuensis]